MRTRPPRRDRARGLSRDARGGGVEEWQAALPTAQLDRGAGMRWALSAYVAGATPAQTFWYAVPDASSGGGASPDDRRCGAGLDGWRADLAQGSTLAAVPVTPPPAPPVPQPPVAHLALADTTAVAGRPLSLDASGSRDPDGQIVAFEWDYNGDGRYEANTGTLPTALFAFGGSGARTIGVRVTDTQGLQSVASLNVELSGSPPGCLSKQADRTSCASPLDASASRARATRSRATRSTSSSSSTGSGSSRTRPAAWYADARPRGEDAVDEGERRAVAPSPTRHSGTSPSTVRRPVSAGISRAAAERRRPRRPAFAW